MSRSSRGDFLSRGKRDSGSSADDSHPDVVVDESFPWQLSRYSVLVAMIFGVGLCLAIPGFAMRLEQVPSPLPAIAINLCPTIQGNYRGSAMPCSSSKPLDDNAAPEAQLVPLHGRMLLTGVTYIPVLIIPTGHIEGQITMHLKTPAQTFFSVTQKLLPRDDEAAFASFANVHPLGSLLQVYHPMSPTPECAVAERGCNIALPYAMKELLLLATQFSLHPTDSTFPLDVYAANATLAINAAFVSGASVTKSSLKSPPVIYLSFSQYELSAMQSYGVRFIIIGIIISFFSIALSWVHSALIREKKHHL